MKTFTKQLLHGVKKTALFLLLGMSAGVMAETYYVRMANDATSWSALTGITAQQIVSADVVTIDSLNTYYFAKGTYMLSATGLDPVLQTPIPVAPRLTAGKIYGGFTGAETAINLATRELEDKDKNGIVEPWEFKNESVIKGEVPFTDLVGGSRRMLELKGGEANGVTFTDLFYYGSAVNTPGSGAIVLGSVTSYPQAADEIDEYAGKLTLCTVRRVKVGSAGPIMLTNKNSQVDQCIIEECTAEGGDKNLGGGAIWMNALGGKVTNSVIRNCESKVNNVGTGKAGAIWAQHPSYDYRSNATDCNTLIYNCLIYNNSAGAYGAAVRVEGKNNGKTKGASVINCTILNNFSPTTGTGALEMVFDGCLAVNNIVLNAADCEEVRLQSARHYASNSIFGTLIGQTTVSPGNDMVSGKSIADLKFVKPLFAVGAAGSPEGDFFDQELYDSIRTANFRISSATSPAVTTPGALTLPATFPSSETLLDPTPIPVIGSIPTTDMLGVSRATTNTLGAYQFDGASALKNTSENRTLDVITLQNSILINNQQGKEVVFYSMSGQMLHKQLLKSNHEIVNLKTGFYVVAVDKLVTRVIIK